MFLLISGWIIVLAAITLLSAGGMVGVFMLAGVAIEAVGLVFLFRAHRIPPGEDRDG